MKVRYTFPAKGVLAISGKGVIEFPELIFKFIPDEQTGFVAAVEIEIQSVPQDRWPSLSWVEPDPQAEVKKFPFRMNPNVLTLKEYMPNILNLEGMLGLVGLDGIDFSLVHEEWLPEQDDEIDALQSSFRFQPSERKAVVEPLSDLDLAKFVVASKTDDPNIAALSFYRVASQFYDQKRYIDAIRYSYLAIEYLYADGQFKKKQTIDAFSNSQELKAGILRALNNNGVRASLKSIRQPYSLFPVLLSKNSVQKWMVDLRGTLQHATSKQPEKWHPSRQERYKNESTFILNVAYEVCWKIGDELLGADA